MHETFVFQKQIERCNLLAEQASSQSEQDFWLQSARRWEAILSAKSTKRSMPKPANLGGQVPSRLTSIDEREFSAS